MDAKEDAKEDTKEDAGGRWRRRELGGRELVRGRGTVPELLSGPEKVILGLDVSSRKSNFS